MTSPVKIQPLFGRTRHVHMVGIGGIGMSGMAEILLHQGYKVSGSDQSESESTERLKQIGATIYTGHHASNIAGADVVVYTSAVRADENEETRAALSSQIPVIKRSEMLAELMRMKYGIGIAGTHGKTTTTTMTGHVVQSGDFDPTIMVGGRVHSFDKTNAVVGKGDIIIVEADEYDRTFLRLSPTIAVITNIEAEHLDIYSDLDDVKNAFIEFAGKVPFYGAVIVCLDDPEIRSILPSFERRTITYGYNPQAQIRAVQITQEALYSSFSVVFNDEVLGSLRLRAPGDHNVRNALAAVAVGIELGMEFSKIKAGLECFEGVFRRFQVKLESKELIIIDDYAHHPTEVLATIKAARNGWPDRRIVAVFQPHLYSRTKEMYKEFGLSFFDAEVLITTDIYPSREKPLEGVTGELISNTAKNFGHKDVHYIQVEDVPRKLKDIVQDGDIVITMGAGDIYKYNQKFTEMMIKK
ncbi:MAG: UDP-N-acetylmuramate--L-alanine ligase [Balneolaceae bacterium]|nr:MAG: UDP-N-acetylmuramate--L-alanine ligase [Balneolaceae bacterium]